MGSGMPMRPVEQTSTSPPSQPTACAVAAHIATKILDGLDEYGALDDTLVIVGGIVPDKDKDELKGRGVSAIFGPGASMADTIEFVRENAPERE